MEKTFPQPVRKMMMMMMMMIKERLVLKSDQSEDAKLIQSRTHTCFSVNSYLRSRQPWLAVFPFGLTDPDFES